MATPQHQPTALATAPSLELRHITKSYGRRRVLDGITHRFTPGLTLLLGPSGAGKSTLLRLLATAERPTSGNIFWKAQPLPGAQRALRRVLGYAPQAVDLPEDLTAREFAQHMAALKGLDLAAADRQFLTLTEAIGLHGDIHFKISTFSGGMRRRLIFAQSLLGSPQLIALDEPTAELDLDTARRVGQLVLQHARTAIVVMTTHLADELRPCAHAILRVERSELMVERSELMVERSELMVERSELMVERNELGVARSELVVERSQPVVEHSERLPAWDERLPAQSKLLPA